MQQQMTETQNTISVLPRPPFQLSSSQFLLSPGRDWKGKTLAFAPSLEDSHSELTFHARAHKARIELEVGAMARAKRLTQRVRAEP